MTHLPAHDEQDEDEDLGEEDEEGADNGEPSAGLSSAPAEDQRPLRLFLGVPLSMRSTRALAAAARELRERAGDSRAFRWVPPARYHLTLKFLGWVRPEVIPAIRDRLSEALEGQAGFEFRCRGLGAFPKPERARVVWAGLGSGVEEVSQLAARVDAATVELGFPREDRPYHPHMTLARIKGGANVVTLLQGAPVQMFSKTVLDRVVLFESSVVTGACEYKRISQWLFEAPSIGSRRQSREVETETGAGHSGSAAAGESSSTAKEQGDNGEQGNQNRQHE